MSQYRIQRRTIFTTNAPLTLRVFWAQTADGRLTRSIGQICYRSVHIGCLIYRESFVKFGISAGFVQKYIRPMGASQLFDDLWGNQPQFENLESEIKPTTANHGEISNYNNPACEMAEPIDAKFA